MDGDDSRTKLTSAEAKASAAVPAEKTDVKATLQLDQRLWRAIDILHFLVMFSSLFTAIIVGILRNDLFEQ
jgi:hypothetical protein